MAGKDGSWARAFVCPGLDAAHRGGRRRAGRPRGNRPGRRGDPAGRDRRGSAGRSAKSRRARAWKSSNAPLMHGMPRVSPRVGRASARHPDRRTRPTPTAAVPPFVPLLAAQPRAGATRPGHPRVMLEPAENHAEHCAVVAVNGVLAAGVFGADPAGPFLTGLAHHLHNAYLPDAGDAGDSLLGEHLRPLMEHLPRPGLAGTPGVPARSGPPMPDGGLPRRHPGSPRLPGGRFRGPRPGNGMARAERGVHLGSCPGRNGHHSSRPGAGVPTGSHARTGSEHQRPDPSAPCN